VRAQVHGAKPIQTRPGRALRGDLAQIAHEQQVVQVRRDRGVVLELVNRLAVSRGAKDAQVPPADAEARQLGDGADDLALGVVVELLSVAALALDDAVVLELLDQRSRGAGLLQNVRQPVQRRGAGPYRERRAPQRTRVRTRRARAATAPPRMKPRASAATTSSTSRSSA
jgi:hypothetical protein